MESDAFIERMRGLIDSDASGKSFQIADDFTSKLFSNRVLVKDAALSVETRNPLTDSITNLQTLLGYTSSLYVVLTDTMNDLFRDYVRTRNGQWFEWFCHKWRIRATTVDALVAAIGEARVKNLIEDVDTQKELQELRLNTTRLRDEKAELRSKVEVLSGELERCQHDFAEYKKHVHKTGGDTAIGPVSVP
jgi:hypothetical protein